MSSRTFRRGRVPALLLAALVLALQALSCAPPTAAQDELPRIWFEHKDGFFSVITGRYSIGFHQGALISFKNVLTGESYDASSRDFPQRLAELPVGLLAMPDKVDQDTLKSADAMHPWRGAYDAKHLKPFVHRIDETSKLTFKQLARNKAQLTWTDLLGPDGKRSGSITWIVTVLPESGDLQIEATARRDTPGVFGVGVGLTCLNPKLNWIFPILEGTEFVPADAEPDTKPHAARWPYPMFAGLVVAEGKRGSLAMWMTDTELAPRTMHWKNNRRTLDIAFESHNPPPLDKSTSATSRTIRINVYQGNWVTAARAFRDHWEKTFDVKPLTQRKPDWLANIRGVMSGYATPPKDYVDKIMIWAPQRWKVQPKVGDGGLFPYDIEKGPELYMIKNNRDEERRLGVHRMVYLNINHMNQGHPWADKFWQHRIRPVFAELTDAPVPEAGSKGSFNVHCAYRPWQDLIIDWARQSRERFGIEGFYMDCASGYAASGGGLVRGMNDARGQVELMKRMKAEIPGCFLSCEYLNEVTAQVVDFGMFGKDHWFGGAQGWREEHVHPLGGFLFNRYAWMHRGWNPAYHETLGKLSRPEPTDYTDKDVVDYAQTESWWDMFFKLQASTMMKAVYPEQWDKGVRSYYRGADGTLYKVYSEVRPEGRMVKVTDAGEELVYWRIKGRDRAAVKPGTGIGGWIAYDGDTAMGLNPASGYLYLGQPRIADWQVTTLPPGAFIDKLRPYKAGTLVMQLGAKGGRPSTGPLTVVSDYPLSHAIVGGVTRELRAERNTAGKHVVRLAVTAPGQVVLTGQDFVKTTIGEDGVVCKLAAMPTELAAYHDASGIRDVMTFRKRPMRDEKNEMIQLFPGTQLGVMEYLLELPAVPEGKKLVLELTGNMNRDKNHFTALARVSASTVIEEKVAGENSMQHAEADITRWADKRVLVTIGVDKGRLFRHAQVIRPRIVVK